MAWTAEQQKMLDAAGVQQEDIQGSVSAGPPARPPRQPTPISSPEPTSQFTPKQREMLNVAAGLETEFRTNELTQESIALMAPGEDERVVDDPDTIGPREETPSMVDRYIMAVVDPIRMTQMTPEQMIDALPAAGGMGGALYGAAQASKLNKFIPGFHAKALNIVGHSIFYSATMQAGGKLAERGIERLEGEYTGQVQEDVLAFGGDAILDAMMEADMSLRYDMATMGLLRAGKYVLGPMSGHILGVRSQKSLADTKAALRRGINVAAAHVSEFDLVRGASKIIGIFPLIGKPFQRGQERIVGEVSRYTADVLNKLAPYTKNAYQISKEAVARAGSKWGTFTNTKAALWNDYEQKAMGMMFPDIISSGPIRQAVRELDIKALTHAPPLVSKGGKAQAMGDFKTTEVGAFLEQAGRLSPRLTVLEAKEVIARAERAMEGASKQERGEITKVIMAVKNALNSPKVDNIPEGAAPWQIAQHYDEAAEAIKSLEQARWYHTNAKSIWERPIGKIFQDADPAIMKEPGVFRTQKVNADEVFARNYNMPSPLGLRDLRKILKPQLFGHYVRKFFADNIAKSVIKAAEGTKNVNLELFNARKLRKNLGLETAEGWANLTEALKGSGVQPKLFAKWLNAAETATDIVIRNPSEFVRRRMLLAGGTMTAMGGSMLIGAGHLVVPAALALTLSLRGMSAWMMSPMALRVMQRSMDQTLSQTVRSQAVSSWMKMWEKDVNLEERKKKMRSMSRGTRKFMKDTWRGYKTSPVVPTKDYMPDIVGKVKGWFD
jgi:hypothetical protein